MSVCFLHPSFTGSAETSALRFRSSTGELPDSTLAARRASLIAERREQVLSDWNTLNLLSDDFRWISRAKVPELEALFSKLENFLAVVSLVDSTTSTKNGFMLRVKSHVVREEVVQWSLLPTQPNVPLRNLYEWCYRSANSGPLSDKLGLVRNFISLYWETSIFDLDLRVVAAVRSGYSLYLKRNLKEFVELRARVTAFILEIDEKATKSVETATGNLEKNFYGVTTFITSVVLIKVLQDKTFTGAFTPQLAALGGALILISAIHAIFARQSTLREMERASTLYDDLRAQYSAFFTLPDFDSIFAKGDKSPVEKTETYVRARLRGLLWVWYITLGIASAIILLMTL